jgi:hypothetical protein
MESQSAVNAMNAEQLALRAHVDRLKPNLDAATYAAIIKALPRVRQILREAKKRELTRFVCGLGLWLYPLPLQITLKDDKGNAYNPSIGLKRVYGKRNDENIPMETALLFMSVVENIFWRFAGMTHVAQPADWKEA